MTLTERIDLALENARRWGHKPSHLVLAPADYVELLQQAADPEAARRRFLYREVRVLQGDLLQQSELISYTVSGLEAHAALA